MPVFKKSMVSVNLNSSLKSSVPVSSKIKKKHNKNLNNIGDLTWYCINSVKSANSKFDLLLLSDLKPIHQKINYV